MDDPGGSIIVVRFRLPAEDREGALGHVLGQLGPKVLLVLGRAPGCLCTAPEAADVLRDGVGRIVGSIEAMPIPGGTD